MTENTCKKCGLPYEEEEGDEGFDTGLCCRCFEDSIEEYEIRRRERIARENEY